VKEECVTELVENPEYEALQEETLRLQSELAHALAELDQWQTQTRPYLYALYQHKIGHVELSCFRVQCKAEWLRRFIEHVQAARNRGATPIIEHIEAELQSELSEYWTGLREAAAKLEAAQRLLGGLMSPEESLEFRRLYYRLVKRLHPDVNPSLTAREQLFWRRVQSAHEAGDLAGLRAIWQGVEVLPAGNEPGRIDDLRGRRQRLLDEIGRVRARLADLERQPPFDLRDKLTDDAWVQGRLAQIAVTRSGHEERVRFLGAQMRTLIGDSYDGLELQFGAD
jgi:hypothetical protein